jgi:hypothetical protein
MSETTHMTEYGVAVCLDASRRDSIRDRGEALGLRPDRAACNGMLISVYDRVLSMFTATRLPTCLRCAVLRDEALETQRVPAGVGTRKAST